MTKRQKTIRHLITCLARLAECVENNQNTFYWEQQIKKGMKIVNIKPWS